MSFFNLLYKWGIDVMNANYVILRSVMPDNQMLADLEHVSTDTPRPGDCDDAQVLMLIHMWSGFESEMITDAQLLTSLGLDYHDTYIPGWMVTGLGVLTAKGDVTVDEFLVTLQYVLENS